MQHWQYRLAEHATELEAARRIYQKAAMRMDRGDRSGEPEASMAKSFATRLANDVARDALQVHGGYGFARQIAATGESTASRRSTATPRSSRSSRAPTRCCSGSSPGT